MSQADQAHELTTNTQRRVVEAVEEAQDALDQWGMKRQRVAAIDGTDPDRDGDVYMAKVEMHARVTRAFRLLRPQIKEYLPNYWLRAEIYDERADPDSDGERVIIGMKTLEGFQERIVQTRTRVERRQKPDETKLNFNVELLPGKAYRRIINLFGECMEHLGYVSPPKKPEALAVAGGDGEGSGEELAREMIAEELEEAREKEERVNVID
jgi:hypothetical protein